jgi:hypothetical protein
METIDLNDMVEVTLTKIGSDRLNRHNKFKNEAYVTNGLYVELKDDFAENDTYTNNLGSIIKLFQKVIYYNTKDSEKPFINLHKTK